ncbi:LPS export ABC transporter periplasmic protein LptC [Lutibacter sp. HS1-25]|uniref:LPS export ABC transporter periplasmic protein LptC n=1 Tax=Lutibacter sp. HS1-25 TaxID=2485000 RepID=UPI0010106FD9|nr:LPS export ABC transporter periplasmic protein LptC [Lutibacter sp. HS1-25]RXP45204.1 LPS export ABC transporter periplasmic protein LptC [Lutibacter sp. HS1-25]
MIKSVVNTIKNIVIVLSIAMFFSCTNSAKEVKDFLADKNLPVGEAYNVVHKYTDSGMVTVKMVTPLMLDFGNREKHPYSEFPEGLKITSIEKNGDSTTVEGDYALNYKKTEVSQIKNNVVITNYSDRNRLETDEIFWDKKTHYFFTESKFTFYTPTDTIRGTGFEASEDLKIWWVKNQQGIINVKE